MEKKSFFLLGDNQWIKWVVRAAFFAWAVILLSYFFWSQLRFFADRLKPFLALLGL